MANLAIDSSDYDYTDTYLFYMDFFLDLFRFFFHLIAFQNANIETIYSSTGCRDGIENWINKDVPLICKTFYIFLCPQHTKKRK